MWQYIVIVGVPKHTDDGTTIIEEPVTFYSDPGQILDREQIRDRAYEAVRDKFKAIEDTVGSVPYDYGEPAWYQIVAVVWVPK